MKQKTKDSNLKEIKTVWDFTVFYKNLDDPKITEDKLEASKRITTFSNKWLLDSSYQTDVSKLKEALEEYSKILESGGTEGDFGYYFDMARCIDLSNAKLKKLYASSVDFSTDLSNKLLFFELGLGKITKDKRAVFLKSKELSKFKFFLEKIFMFSDHQLSEKEEKILSLFHKSSNNNWVTMVEEKIQNEIVRIKLPDGSFKKVGIEELRSFYSSTDINMRKRAYALISKIITKHADTIEYEMNSVLHTKKIEDDLRGYEHPQQNRLIADNLSQEALDTYGIYVAKGLTTFRKYLELKSRLLGLPKLHTYDYVAKVGTSDKNFVFEECLNEVGAYLTEIKIDYYNVYLEAFVNGRVDVFPKSGKMGGAFCAHSYVNQPSFILLNYTNDSQDMSTLAHEFGHYLNNYFMSKKCIGVNFGVPLVLAETASKFFEIGFEDYFCKKIKGTDLELIIKEDSLNSLMFTFFVTYYRYLFEVELHNLFRKNGWVSFKEISTLNGKYLRKVYGDSVVRNKDFGLGWALIPHYRSMFYNYQYSFGLAVTLSFLHKFKRGKSSFLPLFEEFLSTGSSKNTLEGLISLGISFTDSNFWHGVLEEISSRYNELESLAKKLGKI